MIYEDAYTIGIFCSFSAWRVGLSFVRPFARRDNAFFDPVAWDTRKTEPQVVTAIASEVYTPRGLAVDSAGNLYIAEKDSGKVRKVDGAGIMTTVAGGGSGAVGGGDWILEHGVYCGDGGSPLDACLRFTGGLAVDSAGNLYIATSGEASERIRRVEGIVPISVD